MASVGHAFSPKEWKVAIKPETVAGGTSIASGAMYQLDVDSISMPSLNVNQSLDLRTSGSRFLQQQDVFQSNTLRAVELSLSGTLHYDIGHSLLGTNCVGGTNNLNMSNNINVSYNALLNLSQKYAESNIAGNIGTMTVVLQPSDVDNQYGIELTGCLVTSFTIGADLGTNGGVYTWSATLSTGLTPDFVSTAEPTITAYTNTTIPTLTTATNMKVSDAWVVMNSFSCTIENPVSYSGVTSEYNGGYEVISRSGEVAVNIDTQVKYDGLTKGFINEFDAQTGGNMNGNMFLITNDGKYGVLMNDGIFTNVSLSEGDIMMLDCSIKGVGDGTNSMLSIDITS